MAMLDGWGLIAIVVIGLIIRWGCLGPSGYQRNDNWDGRNRDI